MLLCCTHAVENRQALGYLKRKQNQLSRCLCSLGSLTVFAPFTPTPPSSEGRWDSIPRSLAPVLSSCCSSCYSKIRKEIWHGDTPVLAARRNTSFEVVPFTKLFLNYYYYCFANLFCDAVSLEDLWSPSIVQNPSKGETVLLSPLLCCFPLPQLLPSPGEAGRLWTFCRLKKITVSPRARNTNVATLTPPLAKKEWTSALAGLLVPEPPGCWSPGWDTQTPACWSWASHPRPRSRPRPLSL